MTKKKRFGFAQESERPVYAADPKAIYVSIFCADARHEDEKVPICTFIPSPHGGWTEKRSGYQTEASDTLIPVKHPSTHFLNGDEFMSSEYAATHPELVTRTRVKLYCDRHNDPTLIRAPSVLEPIFTKFATVGMKEIEFESFMRRVERAEHQQ